MPNEVWVPLVVAAVSLVTAITSAWIARKAQQDVAALNHLLHAERAEADARRDYEYEARKRLYVECEPILFEAAELAEMFRRRMASLARSARHANILPDGFGWLASPGYYFKSTAYYLLAPITSYKILHRSLTSVDLALDPRLEQQYQLLRHAFDALTWDYELAEEEPGLPYAPEEPDGRRQGLYLGVVDQLAGALVAKHDGRERCKTLGEFFRDLDNPETELGRLAPEISGLLIGFHPVRHPVLWRVLVTQYLLLDVLLRVRRGGGQDLPELLIPATEEGRQSLRCGVPSVEDPAESPIVLAVGRAYLLRRLQR